MYQRNVWCSSIRSTYRVFLVVSSSRKWSSLVVICSNISRSSHFLLISVYPPLLTPIHERMVVLPYIPLSKCLRYLPCILKFTSGHRFTIAYPRVHGNTREISIIYRTACQNRKLEHSVTRSRFPASKIPRAYAPPPVILAALPNCIPLSHSGSPRHQIRCVGVEECGSESNPDLYVAANR